ncbi:MAG: ArnT family glycosyltransferase, partial [bacterium]
MSSGGTGTRREHAILATILCVALICRLVMAVSVPFMYDEYLWAQVTDSIHLTPGPSFHLPLDGAGSHPPAQAYWNGVGVLLLGKCALGYRLGSVLLGVAAVWLVYRLGRIYWSAPVGLLAAGFLAVNEYHLGISQICTQKSYFTFALLFLYLFERTVERQRIAEFAMLGIIAGLGLSTGLTFLVWVPLLIVESLRRAESRRCWRTVGPYLTALICAAIVAPYFVSELTREETSDLAIQVDKSSLGSWSWAPLALYLRPLYYVAVEHTISEYPSMTTVPGALLLAGGGLSLALLRGERARFVQALGLFPFLLFSLFSRPSGEFFWSDFSLPPFILLSAAVLPRLRRWSPVVTAGVFAALLWSTAPLV